jgi:excisionase family DNA binding protein
MRLCSESDFWTGTYRGDSSSHALRVIVAKLPVLTLEEAALFLRVSQAEMEELLVTKQVQGRKIGSKWRVAKDKLMQFLGGSE